MFLARVCSCLLILVFSISAIAKERPRDEVYELDIPRMKREQSLFELGQQVRMNVEYVAGNAEEGEVQVGPIKGNLPLKAAMRTILRDSNLTYHILKPNTLVVETRSLEKTMERLKERALRKPAKTAVPKATAQTVKTVEEVVSYSKLWRDLTRTMVPSIVLERQQIDAIGAPTLSEMLRYITQSAYVRPEGYHTSGAQYAEMRGLGSDTALVLINGRRAMPSASSVTSSAFDLNTIPMAAVERIELKFDSAAVEYGTDAIGGVIDIVLDRKATDPTIEVRHGRAAGGAEQRRGNLRLGTEGGRFNGTLTLDHFDMGGLLGDERDRWSNQDHRRTGGKDHRSPISSAGNITSADGQNLPGLPAPNAAVPIVDSTPGISLSDFVATAGTSNSESLFKYWSVVPEAKRTTLVANGSYKLSDSLSASAEVLYADRNSVFYFSPPALYGMPVAPSNAFNPFGTTVLASRLLSELGSQYQYVESELVRMAADLQGGSADWAWKISALHSREQTSTWIHNELDLSAEGPVMRALASPDPAQALNPFQSGPIGSQELLRSLVAPRQIDNFAVTGKQVLAKAKGKLFDTRAGSVTTTLGAEWRQESGLFDRHGAGWFSRDRDIRSAFLHLRVPLIGEKTALPGIQGLSVDAGSRMDHYEGMNTVIRSQLGLLWQPLRALEVRASGGRTFRPPSLYELYLPKITTPFRVSDPARDNELANVTLIVGGNEALKPATAKTFTAGFAFSSDTAVKWKISADYWRVTMDDRVSALTPALMLANESLFPDRITRADRAGTGVDAGQPAALEVVDSSRINVGRVKASGVDFFAGSAFPTDVGTFTPELRVTWFDSFLATDIPGQPAVERVNLASEFGSILEWRVIPSLGWSYGPYQVTTVARYSPSYDDAVGGVRTGRKVASQTLFDLHSSVDLDLLFGPDSAWSGVKLSVGAYNLFDTEPSVAEVGGAADFDLSQGDLKQSSYYLQVEKKF